MKNNNDIVLSQLLQMLLYPKDFTREFIHDCFESFKNWLNKEEYNDTLNKLERDLILKLNI